MANCKQSAQDSKLPADFVTFYKKFHEDSLFQMEHIIFPLPGIPDNIGAKNIDLDTFKWHPQDWVMHHMFDTGDSVFVREVNVITPDMIEEIFHTKDDGFAMFRRFAKVSGDWKLIYYAGMNKVKSEAKKDSI
jgi:hypothetical protein